MSTDKIKSITKIIPITNINMDKLKKAMKSNKTFEMFMMICYQQNICIFFEENGEWILKSNSKLINDCKKRRQSLYKESIKSLQNLMKGDIDSIEEGMIIDKTMIELKKGIKNLDIVVSLLEDVYNDLCLSKMTEEEKPKKNVLLIEHFSNSL